MGLFWVAGMPKYVALSFCYQDFYRLLTESKYVGLSCSLALGIEYIILFQSISCSLSVIVFLC